MALAITSFAPSTGPTTGGTKVVITGTGLTAVTAVMFGDVEGAIDTTAVNTATSLTVIAPAISNDTAGDKKITLLDSVTPAEAQSATAYTYTAVTLPELVPSLAAKWKCDVDSSVAKDGSLYIPLRGITNFQPAIDTTTQDDSDYDSVDPDTGISWGSDFVTQLKFSLVIKIDRKMAAGYVEDPGQAVVRQAYDQGGQNSIVRVRWYDRNGGPEAFEGFGLVKWSEDGGDLTAKSSVSVTIMGRGRRTPITNPAA